MRRTVAYLTTFLLLVLLWMIGLGCWPLLTGSRLNCSYDDIDVNSGRVRHQRYLAGLCIHESIEETSVSRLVGANAGDKPEEWHRVNTLAPLAISPHHRYHAAIYQIGQIDSIWGSAPFTSAAQAQMAQDVLSLWRTGEGYHPVSDYLDSVEALCSERPVRDEPIDVKDLPTSRSIEEQRASRQPATAGGKVALQPR